MDFEYTEHTADAGFIAYGRTEGEAFVNAARAMAGLMGETAGAGPEIAKDVELRADALDALLYDWLSELLYIFEVDRIVFARFEARVERQDGGYALHAKAYGESFDRHPGVSMRVKAVTYHGLRFEKKDNVYEAQVLLDM